MTSFLDLCENFFQSRDFYEILKIKKTASEKDVKKAYHKLSLLVHPDRVEENEKAEATEKFKVLGRIHSVLGDKEKRKVYDETGQFDDDEVATHDWAAYWRMVFKPISIEDINNYEKNYKNSETELKDLKRAYVDSKGNMDYIFETVPFISCDDEPRLHELIRKMIDNGEVEEYKTFTQEPESKKLKRRKKWEKEAEEAKLLDEAVALEKEDGFTDDTKDLALLIQRNQQNRARTMNNFFDMLTEKYSKPKSRCASKSAQKRKKSPTKGSTNNKRSPSKRLKTKK